MEARNSADRRDNDRRTQDNPIDIDRRTSQRRSGFDRREILSDQTA
tara:strand:+ start:2647 stop:2784 length:138 start_codon:yes stop_codon:yes gene_type:complete